MPHMSREQEKAMFAKKNQGNPRSSVMPQVVGVSKVKKPVKSNVPDFVNNKVLTEAQLNLLKRRLNDKKITQNDIFGQQGKVFLLTPEQTKKGLDFLNNERRTPKGVERKNNPFGAREEAVLDNFDRFEVGDFFDAGNQFVTFNVPLFRVVAKDGSTFEYHFSGGKVNITG